MKNISVISIIFNEEDRISHFIESFTKWSDDVILIDKSSTDNTKKIIEEKIKHKTNLRLLEVPYTDRATIIKKGLEIAKNEWVFLVTASDIMDDTLGNFLIQKINEIDFNYDYISIPYQMYVFGICSPHSPWYSEFKTLLGKKSALVLSDKVHEEFRFEGKQFLLNDNSHGYYAHLTHRNLEVFLERHIRYCKMEPDKFFEIDRNISLKSCYREILFVIKDCIFNKKVFKLGWDGKALFFGILSYYFIKFLFVWESKRDKNGEQIYESIYKEKEI